jgi:hypothetical protein
MWLELNSTILSFEEHQTEILVQTAEGTFSAFPDFSATTQDGTRIVLEVKPEAEQVRAETARRLAAIRAHYERNRTQYHVVCGVALARPIGYSTLLLLTQLRSPSIKLELSSWQPDADWLRQTVQPTLGDLADQLGSWISVLKLMANDHLTLDLTQPLTRRLPACFT